MNLKLPKFLTIVIVLLLLGDVLDMVYKYVFKPRCERVGGVLINTNCFTKESLISKDKWTNP